MIQSGIWWLFLGLAPILYWSIPGVFRAWFLGSASIALLTFFVGYDLILMIAVAAFAYYGRRLNSAKWPQWVISAGSSTFPTWVVFIYFMATKYAPAMANIFALEASFADFAVPLGVSYFSFKLLHYTIENRWGNFAEHGLGDYVSWLFLAPIFTAGPIERFDHFLFYREVQKFEFRFIREGIERISIGIVKKFMLGMIVLEAMQQSGSTSFVEMAYYLDDFSALQIWAILLLGFLYIYLDFSGYSDIAIGSSRLFGFRIIENFHFPFLAVSLPDLWLRWHISLALWVRTYIYMALVGMTRNPYFAVIVSFTMMGLWHALSLHWAVWGLWHGCGLAIYVLWYRFKTKRKIKIFHSRLGNLASRILTLSFVALGGAFTALHDKAPITASFEIILAAFGVRF
jgi:alginate O-acetyltransferase complex protein AlgI